MRFPLPCLAVAALVLSACGGTKPSRWPASPQMQVRACSLIAQGTPGSEDIVVDDAGKFAFISSDPRRADKQRSGAIYAYNLQNRGPAVLAVDTTLLRTFRPHGMGLFTASNGDRLLFVVNHGRGGEAVQIFRVNGARLELVDAIRDPALVRGNDVVPVGPRSFYVTNSQVSHTRFGAFFEILLTRGHSYVLFYDGEKYTRVVKGLSFANGVNVSADGTLLYVTTSVGKDIRVYRRGQDGSHMLLQRIRLGTGADNIDVDSSGGLWVAAHPNQLAFARYTAGRSEHSPSEVLYFPKVGDTLGTPMRLVPRDSLRPASSVAVRRGNRMLVGSVSDSALDCEFAGGPPR
jgi:arylesterase/paraoxonase